MELTLADLKREARKHGATVEENKALGRFAIEAPHGRVWSCDFIHEIVQDYVEDIDDWRAEAIGDAIERMQYGTEECSVFDCEWCGGV